MFCATMMNIFEGNASILNLYAEADHPKHFFTVISSLFVGISVFLGIMVGVLGYFAFGNACQSTILLNMPNEASIGIVAKICYITTIVGSYVLLVHPLFYVIENSSFYHNLFESAKKPSSLES